MTNALLYRSGVFPATNKSGGHLAQGAVGVLSDEGGLCFNVTNVAGYTDSVVVVVVEPDGIDDNVTGMVACAITVPKLLLDADASLLDWVKTSGTEGLGTPHSGDSDNGDFAQVLGTGSSPPAIIFGRPASNGIATPLKQVWDPDAPPASPSTLDDECNGGSVDVQWTELDFGSKLTIDASAYNLYRCTVLPGSGHSVAGLAVAIPAGDFSIMTKVGLSHFTGNSFEGGLALWQDLTSGSDIKTWSYRAAGGMNRTATIDLFTAYNANSVGAQIDVYTGAPHPRGLYLRIRRNGTDYYYDWSADGISWDTYNVASNPSFTPGYFGIFVNNTPSSVTRYADFHFFRYLASDIGYQGILAGQLAGIYS